MVGAPNIRGQPGSAYVFYGADERLSGHVSPADADATIVGVADGDELGRGVAIADDLDGDGFAELVVSAPRNDAAGEDAGAVYVVPGGDRLSGSTTASDVAGLTLTREAAGDLAGGLFEGLHGVGDIDADGGADLLAAASGHDGGGEDAGVVYGVLLSDVGIAIESPDGASGSHFYQLWQPTTNETLHGRMRSLGMRAALVRHSTFDHERTAATMEATADVPWAHSPYTVQATTPRAAPLPPGGNTWWRRGPRGIIRISYEFHEREIAFGTASVTADEGSPLPELLGARERTADQGVILLIHRYEGDVELVGEL